MRRSISQIEPPVARAGEINTWKFIYTTSVILPKGAKFKFDLQSKGRSIDWQIPSTDLTESENVIYAVLDSSEVMAAKCIELPENIVPQYEFTLPRALKIGEKITVSLGAPPKSRSKDFVAMGNQCQLAMQRRRTFLLYIDPKGRGNYDEPETFSLDIRGGPLHTIRVLAPSFVSKNKRFDLTVRFEDEFGNLTNHTPPDTLIELSYENIRENLSWKLFVPETGFVILPNLYFNEAGIYKVRLKNMLSKEVFTSAPIKCFQENDRNLFWGLLHGESERVDSTENIENCLRHFRDERALNFFASSCFESVEETSNETFKLISQNIQDFNEEDRFVTLLGFQYQGETRTEGLRHMLYPKDSKPLIRQKEIKSSSLAKIYKSLSPKDLISIPTFTMGSVNLFDFKNFNPDFERVVEIYNAWGCSERSKAEGNPYPITGGVEGNNAGSIIAALKRNCRFGFVAGGLDDRGSYSSFFDSEQVQYSPGLTAIISKKYSRDFVFEALYNRACYATSGPKIIVGFYIAGAPMGSELSTQAKPGLAVNRHISGYVATIEPIEKVEIVRNGEVIKTFHPSNYHFDYYHDDMDNMASIVLDGNGKAPFVFYYLRVYQKDGHMAWSSPIWVDHLNLAPPKESKKGK